MNKLIFVLFGIFVYTSLAVETFQWIVIGSGPGGATMARKLSDYFPSDRVLLVEAGPDNLDPQFTNQTCTPEPHLYGNTSTTTCTYPAIINPRRWLLTMGAAKFPPSVPQVHVNNRVLATIIGGAGGGGTSTNGMIGFRGLKDDLNYWANITGLEEYGYQSMMSYYKKIEKNEDADGQVWTRLGSNGPVEISNEKLPSLYNEPTLLQSALNNGINPTNINHFQMGGLSRTQRTITTKSVRVSAATAYLDSTARSRPNLVIRFNTNATRILFNNVTKTAYGVEFINSTGTYTANVTKEVIVSAGSMETPAILKVSGVGPSAELTALSIPVVLDSPAVGTNFHDQPLTLTQFYFNGYNFKMNETLLFSNDTFQQWKANGTGPLTSVNLYYVVHGGVNGYDVEFHEQATIPDMTPYNTSNWVRIICFTGLPNSRGTIKLNPSGIYGTPLIDPNMFADPSDLQQLVTCNLVMRKILAEAGFTSGDLDPPTANYSTISSSATSDSPLVAFIKGNVQTTSHNCGSVAFGNSSAAVDGKGKVRGLTNVRVVDYSLAPRVLRTNPSFTLYSIAEKIADYIREDYLNTLPVSSSINTKLSLSFYCTPPNPMFDDYSVWQVSNNDTRPYVYHWTTTQGIKGSFAVESAVFGATGSQSPTKSYFFTPISAGQTVTLIINGANVTTATAGTTVCACGIN